MIRIIGGKWKGLHLNLPDSRQSRPTSARVRESIFNILDHRINWQDYFVFDLYAGSGALGIEALSRGAKQAYFIEKSVTIHRCLQSNLKKIKCSQHAIRSMKDEALHILQGQMPMHDSKNLIFFDPPYQSQEYEKVLVEIANNPYFRNQTWVIVEMMKKKELETTGFCEFLCKNYGDTKVMFLEKQII